MTNTGLVQRAIRLLLGPILSLCLAPPAAALELAWPEGAEQAAGRSNPTSGYLIATGVFSEGAVPTRTVEGALTEEVWHIPGDGGRAPLLLPLLREQIADAGFAIEFSCAARGCGGFDFRYALPIAEGPVMYVDLGQFHYLSAMRETEDGTEHLALTISHGGRQGYAHLVRIAPPGALPPPVIPSASASADGGSDGADLLQQLVEHGYTVLDDLTFATGASALSGNRYESLVSLAGFLTEDAARRVVLVGHTDAEGSLNANIALSEARAGAVRQFLIDTLGVNPAQVESAGIGYLSPRAANTDADGREANRRVEVVLIGN